MSDPTTLSPGQIEFLHIFNNTATILSFLALAFFFGNHYLSSKTQYNFSLTLICNLFFADLIYTICNLLSNITASSPILCKLEGFFRTYALWSSVIWATIIGYVAYIKTVKNERSAEKKYLSMLLFGHGLPLIISTIPFFPVSIQYKTNGAYCWVIGKDDIATAKGKFAILLIWAWMAIGITTSFYYRVFKYLKDMEISTAVLEVKKVLIFPIILYIAFIPVTIVDLQLFPKYFFELKILHIVCLHSLGVLNVLAYGFQRIKGGPVMRRLTGHSVMMSRKVTTDVHDDPVLENQEPFDVNDESFGNSFDSNKSVKNTLIEATTMC